MQVRRGGSSLAAFLCPPELLPAWVVILLRNDSGIVQVAIVRFAVGDFADLQTGTESLRIAAVEIEQSRVP